MTIRTTWLGLLIMLGCLAGNARAIDVVHGDRYVSMGSSYAAGPGVGERDAAGGECARSQSNYARQVASRYGLNLVDVSCSGAVTDNILVRGQHGLPPQIDAVTADTRLVTVLIGGNDVGYVADLNGLTCEDTNGSHCTVLSPAEVDRRFAVLPNALQHVIDQIRQRANNAKIVLVGYLPAIPASGQGICEAVPMSVAHASRMRSEAERLAKIMADVASRNGADLVPSTEMGHRHDACSSIAYVAGYRPEAHPGWSGPVPYHPTQAGMNQVADAIQRIVAGRSN